jgi:hypothetical protein
MDDWKPTTMARLELVEEAAKAAWRRKRCARVEATRIAKRMRTALHKARRLEEGRLDAAMRTFRTDPQATLDALVRSRAGVDRLIAMWSEIAEAARAPEGWVDDDAHHFALMYLHGMLPADPPMVPLRDASNRLFLRNHPELREVGDPPPLGDAEAVDVAAMIRRMALAKLKSLRELRAALPGAPIAEAEAEAYEP